MCIFINFLEFFIFVQCIFIVFIPSFPPNSPHIHVNLLSLHNFMSYLLLITQSPVYCQYTHGCWAIYWSVTNYQGAYSKKPDFPAPEAHQLDGGALEPLAPLPRIFTWSCAGLMWTTTASLSSWVQMPYCVQKTVVSFQYSVCKKFKQLHFLKNW